MVAEPAPLPSADPLSSADDVRSLLAANFPAGAGAASYRVVGPTYSSGNSRIFYAEYPAFDVPLAVKFCRDKADARLQFEALQRIAAALAGDAGFTVPRPFGLIDGDCVVVSEWIDGRSVDRELDDWRVAPARAAETLGRCGGWLRRFHDAAAEAAAPLDTRAALERLADEFAAGAPAAAGNPDIAVAVAGLRRNAAAVAAMPLPVSWMHGDFKPANIMLAGPRTVGIDIRRQFRASVVRDQAYFLTHLDLACCHPRGLRLLPWRGRLAAAFLDGYGWSRDGWPDAPLTWMRLHTMVRIWIGLAAGRGTGKRYLAWCCKTTAGGLARRLAAEV